MSGYLDNVKAGKKVMEEIGGTLSESYLIDGKTPEQWQEKFRLSIPQDARPEDIRNCNSKLLSLFNIASFYLANAQLIHDAIDQGARDEYITKFEAKVAEYQQADKKLPARDTLKDLAEAGMRELNGAKANASMKLRWWKHVMTGLSEQRKSIEQIMWITRAEMQTEFNR